MLSKLIVNLKRKKLTTFAAFKIIFTNYETHQNRSNYF